MIGLKYLSVLLLSCVVFESQQIAAQISSGRGKTTQKKSIATRETAPLSLTEAKPQVWRSSGEKFDYALMMALCDKVIKVSPPLPPPPPKKSLFSKAPVTLASIQKSAKNASSYKTRMEGFSYCIVKALEPSLTTTGPNDAQQDLDVVLLGALCQKGIDFLNPKQSQSQSAIAQQSAATGSNAQKLSSFAKCVSFSLGTGVAGKLIPASGDGTQTPSSAPASRGMMGSLFGKKSTSPSPGKMR